MKAAQLEFANQMSCSAQLNLASKHTDAFSSINTNLHAPRNSKLPAFSIHGSKCHSISKRSFWKEFQEQGGNASRRKSGLSSRAAGTSCCSNEHQITKEDGPQKLPLAARFLKLFSRRKDPITRKSSIIQEALDGVFEIQLRDISRVYGKRTVVDGVNLSVKQGEVVGLLGPNGAGKSTTFNITVGRERPTQGCVMLNGQDITPLSLDARARLGVGYLTQEPSVFRGLSVHDNLLLILQETGVPRAQQAGRIRELLEKFRLMHVQHTMGGALSGGERRRTELARALASNCCGGPPKILLVDEPFAGVDPIGVAEIQGLLRQLCDELHMGILITDHNVTETLKICDRAYMVFQGQVMAQGPPQELVRNPYVREYYLGEGYKPPDWQIDGRERADAIQVPPSLEKGSLR